MTTMLNSDADDKSTQSFRIPLAIVRDDPKHDQSHYSSAPAYGGDLLVTATYKRNIVHVSDSIASEDKNIILLVVATRTASSH